MTSPSPLNHHQYCDFEATVEEIKRFGKPFRWEKGQPKYAEIYYTRVDISDGYDTISLPFIYCPVCGAQLQDDQLKNYE